MSYTYTTIDGQRVETQVGDAFHRMNADFTAENGCSLVITSGTRTDAEQEAIFRQRYVTAANVKGRKVYDTRNWNGTLWYRISAAGTVAVPGTSNHQESGPNGPRSIDIRDTGADAGVMTRGTKRDLWMQAHAAEYGYENEGYNFGEPWHKTWRGTFGSPTPPPTAPAGVGDQATKDRQNFLNVARGEHLVVDGDQGPATNAAYDRYEVFLRAYGYTGAIDHIWGPRVQAAHAKYYAVWSAPATPLPASNTPNVSVAILGRIGNVQGLQKIAKKYGYTGLIDNKWGGGSQGGFNRFLAANYGGSVTAWLRAKWGYVGNEQMGPIMTAALQRANAANNAAL